MNAEMTRHIESQLKDLKLKGILGCYRDIAEKASMSKVGYEEYLSLLLEEELKGRNESALLEEFDFSFQPSLGEKEVMRLGSLDFIEKKENLVFLGPPGVVG